MRWTKFGFAFLVGLIFCCREHKPSLREIVLQSPRDIADPVLLSLNPGMGFHRVRIVNQIRRATPYLPGQKLKLGVISGKVRFSFGIVPEYFLKVKQPVEIQIFAANSGQEKLIWSQTISAKDAPGWQNALINLPATPVNLFLTSNAQDCGLAVTPLARIAEEKPSRPSIIFILIDALRSDHLGAYGYSRNTSPNIDGLARSGAIFQNAVTASTFTATSLAGFFTGFMPWEHKMIFGYNLILDPKLATLAVKLREAGYSTAGFSSTYFHLSDLQLDRGFDLFDESCDKKFFSGDAECLSDQVVRWLDEKPDQPFFLYLHYTSTHAPYSPPEPFQKLFSAGLEKPGGEVGKGEILRFGKNRKWYQIPRPPAKNETEWLISQYDGEVRYADSQIARVLEKMEKQGSRKKALIIITADHGEAFYEHQIVEHINELHWPVVRVPLILSGPGIPAGKEITGLVRSQDLAISILDLVRAPGLAEATGKSFLPLLQGKQENKRAGYAVLYESKKNYEITVVYYPYQLLVSQPGDKNIELYNIETDPDEQNNLALQKPGLTRDMLKLLPEPETVLLRRKPGLPKIDQETLDRLKTIHYLK